jgi:hypothetical protein
MSAVSFLAMSEEEDRQVGHSDVTDNTLCLCVYQSLVSLEACFFASMSAVDDVQVDITCRNAPDQRHDSKPLGCACVRTDFELIQ